MTEEAPASAANDVRVEDATSVAASDATATPTDKQDDSARKEYSYDAIPAVNSYRIKPALEDKFRENPIKEIIRNSLTMRLAGRIYNAEKAKTWTIDIANDINTRIRELRMKRYKHVVQVIIGELKGAGVKTGVRCLWDSETDGYTSENFINDTIFCVVVVFAVYLY